jgi:hypothetical protein
MIQAADSTGVIIFDKPIDSLLAGMIRTHLAADPHQEHCRLWIIAK